MRFDSQNDRLIRGGGSLETTPTWAALEDHFSAASDLDMRELFRADPGRFDRFSIDVAIRRVHYSSHLDIIQKTKTYLYTVRPRGLIITLSRCGDEWGSIAIFSRQKQG